tara:strand:+ start:2013 stop:2477 length:465 start_codon:yes stop_codon:yes gene_type:complete
MPHETAAGLAYHPDFVGRRERILEQLQAKCSAEGGYCPFAAYLESNGLLVHKDNGMHVIPYCARGECQTMRDALSFGASDEDLARFDLAQGLKVKESGKQHHDIGTDQAIEYFGLKGFEDRFKKVFPVWYDNGCDLTKLHKLVLDGEGTEILRE